MNITDFLAGIPVNAVLRERISTLLEDKQRLEKKVEALLCYKSQLHRSYINENFVYSLATVRGVQAGTQYAEAFEVVRYII